MTKPSRKISEIVHHFVDQASLCFEAQTTREQALSFAMDQNAEQYPNIAERYYAGLRSQEYSEHLDVLNDSFAAALDAFGELLIVRAKMQ